jgi:hypothetical protein
MIKEACETLNDTELDELRCLTEVEHLNRFRHPDGSHDVFAVSELRKNLIPAVKEAAMPYAVSTVYHHYADGRYWWLDKTPEQVAASGYLFHRIPAARSRVSVEVSEARDLDALEPDQIRVFISPKMAPKDASYHEAKREHLADDDMVRIHMIDSDEQGNTKGKYMQSLLIRHIPLSAWMAMLKDPDNIFGKSVPVTDEESALSVMEAYPYLTIPKSALPKGVISIIEAVLPYADERSQVKILEELKLFETDQAELHRKAESIAERWLAFEIDLADSLHVGYASHSIINFIQGLAYEWNNEMAAELQSNIMADGRLRMTKSLAAKLETSKRNTLWVAGGVVTGNKWVLKQLKPEIAQQIYANELFLQTAIQSGIHPEEIKSFEISNDRLVAHQNATAGAGCPGSSKGLFGSTEEHADHDGEPGGEKCPEVRDGQNVRCPGCKKIVKAIVPNRETIFCSNPKCKLAAPNLKEHKVDSRSHQQTPKLKIRPDETSPIPERNEYLSQRRKNRPSRRVGSLAVSTVK